MKPSKEKSTAKKGAIAELRLALLKENFQFLDFFEQLDKSPYDACTELRMATEDRHAYIMRTDLMTIRTEPFFGGIAEKLSVHINPAFIRETQIVNIPVEEILCLFSPTKDLDDLTSPQLRLMLPRLFHQDAVVEYGLETSTIRPDIGKNDPDNTKIKGLAYQPAQDAHVCESRKGELNEICATCPKRPTCTEACPEVLRFIEQNSVKRYKPQINLNLEHHEHLLKADLRCSRSDLIDQFTAVIDQIIQAQKDAQGLDRRLQAEWATMSPEKYPYVFAKPWDYDNSRVRQEAWEQLKVWRHKKGKKSFPQIAREMGKTVDWVSKSFYSVYEKIQGAPYQPDKIKQVSKIREVELEKTCGACPTRAACSVPCPEILKYIDQDAVHYTRESLYDPVNNPANGPTDLTDLTDLTDPSEHE